MTIEFLLFESSFKQFFNPYIQNLKRLGIQATIRIVDVANFKRRQDSFDFDIVIRRIAQPLTLGWNNETISVLNLPECRVPSTSAA